ncbi:IS30 family transposase [bacterium]|nr:IS30 family transposase [bacterium]
MKRYRHLSLEERQVIYKMRKNRAEIRQIAEALCRHRTTIVRELERNRSQQAYLWCGYDIWQRAKYADESAKQRQKRSHKRLRLKTQEIREFVIEHLCRYGWSPEEIADNINKYLPGAKISARAIRYFIQYEAKELKQYLWREGKVPRQRIAHSRSRFKQAAPPKRSIHERIEAANDRLEAGHLEADLVLSCRSGRGAVLSIIDRKTRHPEYLYIEDLSAESVFKAMVKHLNTLPAWMTRTLTLDNGSEFAVSVFTRLETIFPGLKLYYCDPYKACQRGTVEWSNGRLRKYFPKGTDFSKISLLELEKVTNLLRNRHLKVIQGLTPAQAHALALNRAA